MPRAARLAPKLILILIALALCHSASAEQSTNAHSKLNVKMHFCAERCKSTFEISTTPEIVIYTSWIGLHGEHLQLMKLIAPNGEVYQIFTNSVLSTTRIQGDKRSFGPVMPIPNRLPISGTVIDQRAMIGLWATEIYLDGQFVKSDQFELQ